MLSTNDPFCELGSHPQASPVTTGHRPVTLERVEVGRAQLMTMMTGAKAVYDAGRRRAAIAIRTTNPSAHGE